MKTVITILMFAALSSTAFAKKHAEESPIYDRSGIFNTSSGRNGAEGEAHITVADRTYDAYCDRSGNSISCTDQSAWNYEFINWGDFEEALPPIAWMTIDGKPIRHISSFCSKHGDEALSVGLGRTCSGPFAHLTDGHFVYRIVKAKPSDARCIPWDFKDDKCIKHPAESCY